MIEKHPLKKRLQEAEIPEVLSSIVVDLNSQGGKAILVGGWVRDCLMGHPCKDLDLEVYGVNPDFLFSILKSHGRPSLVGKAFGVYHMDLQGQSFDFTFPRRESKWSAGHKGFQVEIDPHLGFEEAALRRDFTINAMGMEVATKELLDPHGGFKDLEKKILRHVSHAFSEDPLRALRAVQFAARFEFEVDPETKKLCAELPLEELPPERVFEEFRKLLLKARKPSIGMELMKEMNMLRFFPELESLVDVPQDPEWHPEGDVWVHNNMVLDAAAQIRDGEISGDEQSAEFDRLALMLGSLCHDLGKPSTTVRKDGKWRSPGHDALGERPTRNFLARLTNNQKLVEEVVVFVREHLKPALLYNARNEIKPSAIRRLSLRVDIAKLVRTAKADHFGRTTQDALERRFEAGDWLLEQSKNLNVLDERPKPWLTGKALLSFGMKPGPEMGRLIHMSFELQLEGQFQNKEEVFHWAKEQLGSS